MILHREERLYPVAGFWIGKFGIGCLGRASAWSLALDPDRMAIVLDRRHGPWASALGKCEMALRVELKQAGLKSRVSSTLVMCDLVPGSSSGWKGRPDQAAAASAEGWAWIMRSIKCLKGIRWMPWC